MPSFPIIDVAIGLIFIYLTLSLVITASNELIASILARRQKTLLLGIRNLLGDDLADKVYQHPLIRSLRNDHKLPSYIPSRSIPDTIWQRIRYVQFLTASRENRIRL